MRPLPLLAVALLAPACHGPALGGRPYDLSAHAPPPGGGPPAGTPEDDAVRAFGQSVEALRAAWATARTADPETGLATGRDLRTPAMEALRARTLTPEFPASLAAGVPLATVEAAAYERHPGLAAARLTVQSRVEQFAQVAHLETLLEQYASFVRDARLGIGMALPGDRLDFHFPAPGTLELKAAVVRHAVAEARAGLAKEVGEVLRDARIAHARLVDLEASERILADVLGLLEQVAESAHGRLAAGTGSKTAVLQAQVEVSKVRTDLVTLRREQEVTRARLRALMDLGPDVGLGPAGPSPLPPRPPALGNLLAEARAVQPDLLRLQARVDRMTAMIALAERTTYPGPSPNLGEMRGLGTATGGSDRERDPLAPKPKVWTDPWLGAKDAWIAESRTALRAAQARLEAARNHTRLQVESAVAARDTAQRVHELYRDVHLAQAQQAYEDAAAAYRAARGGFLEVLDALRRLLAFRLESEHAQAEVRAAHARLVEAVGTDLGS